MDGPELPVRWEGTGNQYWFASPADWAAATGQHDVLLHLLHDDPNLLLHLTSLRRLRRLHLLWDRQFPAVAASRAAAARRLFRDSPDALLSAGYGPFLLYCAASGADLVFAIRLLRYRPLLVFGEGDYGLSDLFFAASAGGSVPVFRLFMRRAQDACPPVAAAAGRFATEVHCRAAHAAAKGGNWEIMEELLIGFSGGGGWERLRDASGATLLHSAAGQDQVEVIEGLLRWYGNELAEVKDARGSAAIHVAAFRGHAAAVKALIPTSVDLVNEAGDTALHVAVLGFAAPGFRPLDRQIEVVRTLLTVDYGRLVNALNNQGRTPLHLAMEKNIHADAVSLLTKAPAVKVDTVDVNGSTAFDVLHQRWQRRRRGRVSITMQRLVSSMGMQALKEKAAISAMATEIRESQTLTSPGSKFHVHDSELLLLVGDPDGSRISQHFDWTDEEDEEFIREEGESVYQQNYSFDL